ncbi:hypothetical protein STCU_05541 [Strigomonas culicis]|uniref:Uncharacterized protein n=1 Tax=Strigomonas culicis TaxID=28005 RepID=S9UAI3_9TRYP|nr:hypothetical protein STCU_05541 [Strigomonas culicis]|eukprot:EPY27797.1 hypothetical protein STCU_05541 [Strigomonas culicis]
MAFLLFPFPSFFFCENNAAPLPRMKRFSNFACLGCCESAFFVSKRHNMLEHRTKGSPYMKHLDIYARRDPQLAPYLLREIDIEYKRKCRKVQFLLWVVVFTLTVALQTRMQGETLHYMRLYATFVKAERDAKDDDSIKRRRAFVNIMNVVKEAFDRDRKWSKDDEKKVIKAIRECDK